MRPLAVVTMSVTVVCSCSYLYCSVYMPLSCQNRRPAKRKLSGSLLRRNARAQRSRPLLSWVILRFLRHACSHEDTQTPTHNACRQGTLHDHCVRNQQNAVGHYWFPWEQCSSSGGNGPVSTKICRHHVRGHPTASLAICTSKAHLDRCTCVCNSVCGVLLVFSCCLARVTTATNITLIHRPRNLSALLQDCRSCLHPNRQ